MLVTGLISLVGLAAFASACDPISAKVDDDHDGSGGSDAALDQSSDAGTDASDSNHLPLQCAPGGLEFKLVGKERFCFDGCDHPVTLTRLDAGAVSVATGPCEALCNNACTVPDPRGCGFQCGPGLYDFGTSERRWTWDGTVFVDGHCDSSGYGSVSCRQSQCAEPGRYVAKVCGAYGDAVAASNFPNACKPTKTGCVEVEFDWPSTTPIVLTLP